MQVQSIRLGHASTALRLAKHDWRKAVLIAALAILAGPALANDGKLLGAAGLSSIDGSAGGGLVPWAVIAGYGEQGQWDTTGAVSYVDTGDFNLRTASVSVGWNDRLELSAARLSLGLDALVAAGAFPDVRLDTDVLAAKLRLGGDLIYGDLPQLSAGVQWRHSRDRELIDAVGADDTTGYDVYLAASRLWIAGIGGRRTLANVTLRSTGAHQLGLLGFDDDRTFVVEGSLAVFVTPTVALGAEYRSKPDALALAPEDDWFDVFVGWFPNKHWHAALAYVDLGSVGGVQDQQGFYLTIKGSP